MQWLLFHLLLAHDVFVCVDDLNFLNLFQELSIHSISHPQFLRYSGPLVSEA